MGKCLIFRRDKVCVFMEGGFKGGIIFLWGIARNHVCETQAWTGAEETRL